MSHPEADLLLAKAAGDAIGAVEEHLAAGCPRCLATVADYQTLLAALASEAIVDPPDAWVAEAVRVGKTPVAARWTDAARGLLDAFRATLVQDLSPHMAMAGVRGGASLARRQLLYRSPAGTVHLSLAPREEGGVSLRGQLLPAADLARLDDGRFRWKSDQVSGDATLSPHGEFGPCDLPAGPVEMEWQWEGGRIVVDDLTV